MQLHRLPWLQEVFAVIVLLYCVTKHDKFVSAEQNITLRVATVQHAPYVFIKEGRSGNDKYTGFIPDLIASLCQKLDVKYEFYQAADGQFGSLTEQGSWNGLIGELANKKADIAAAAMTITAKRSRVVDFIHPFAGVTITAVMEKPKQTGFASSNFSFNIFKPLDAEIWLCIAIAVVLVWLFFWLMNRYNPYEYGKRHRSNLATEEQSELFSISGSLWYTFTLLQWQGYDRAPRSLASKMLSCIWMCFVTVTLVTYMSSFVNYLLWFRTADIVTSQDPLIDNLDDLIQHKHGYNYGTIKGSFIEDFMRTSKQAHYETMWEYWQSDAGKHQLVNSQEEGIQRVKQGNYALLMESPEARYLVQQVNCALMTTDVNFGVWSYGMAVHLGSTYLNRLHLITLELIESGYVKKLEKKWFQDRSICLESSHTEGMVKQNPIPRHPKPASVTFAMFWIPLVIMAVGIVVSALVAAAEILWYKHRSSGELDKARKEDAQLTSVDHGAVI